LISPTYLIYKTPATPLHYAHPGGFFHVQKGNQNEKDRQRSSTGNSLHADPYEMKNLIKHPRAGKALSKMKQELARLLKETGAHAEAK